MGFMLHVYHIIGSISLTHCYNIFPWLCAWDVCYIKFCHLLHIHSGKNRDFVFIIIAQFMMSANSRVRFGLQFVFVCLHITLSHYKHCANLSEDIELTKCMSDICCVRISIFYQLSFIQHMGPCDFSLPTSSVMIERIHILCLIIITKSEVWTIIQCLY